MPTPNNLPINPKSPQIGWNSAALTTANTTTTGTSGTTSGVVFTGAANYSRLDYLRVRHLGTNVATVLRVFINNGSDASDAGNNTLFTEATIAAATLSQVAALGQVTIAMNVVLPPGYTVFCTIGTTIAAGIKITAVGGDY